MKTAFIVFFLSATTIAVAQSKPVLQPGAMQEDLSYLRRNLEAAHPGLYKHHTAEAMNYLMDSLAATLTQPLPFLEFYKKIAYLIAEVKCEHTSCGYGSGFNKLIKTKRFFPLQLFFINDKAHVLVNLTSDTAIHLGDELLAINQYPIDSIKRVLHQYIPSDGSMSLSKDHQLSSMAFNIWYYLFVEQADRFDLTVRNKEGEIMKKTYNAYTLKKLNAQAVSNPVNKTIFEIDQREKQWRKEPLKLELMQEEKAATIFIQDLSVDQTIFRPTIDSFFTMLSKAGTEKLIINIANNGGGDEELAADLLSYFITSATRLVTHSYLITDSDEHLLLSNIPAEIRKAKYNYIDSLKDGKSYTKLTKYSGELKLLQPRTNRFAGKVYVLVNAGTASAASTFAAVMKSKGLATIVGEETGGSYVGGGTTNGLDLTLPNSKITAHISIIYQRFNTDGGDPDTGVIPDIPYRASFDQLMEGERKWKEFILALK